MQKRIDGGILAGGLSRRMSGRNKGLVLFDGQPMVHWVAQSLRPFVASLTINCNSDQEQYHTFADQVCSDLLPGFKGPLCGLHTLLSHSSADYLLTSSCDTPLLSSQYGTSMLAALESDLAQNKPSAPVYCARTEQRVHPLHLLISTQCLESLQDAIQQNQLRVMAWLSSQNPCYVDFSEAGLFANFNSPEDLKSRDVKN